MEVNKDVLQIFTDLGGIQIIQIVAIILAAWIVIQLLKRFLPWLARIAPSRFRFYILPLVPILRLVILISAVVLIIFILTGPTFQKIAAIAGALAFAVGFAFKGYITSLAAGTIAIYERPYRPGDWVKIDDAYGEVKSVETRALQLVTPDDTTVTIPHNKIWNNNIYNSNDGRRELMCVANFYLNPKHDAKSVRHKLKDVALTSPYLQVERPVIVIVQEEPWGTRYQLKAYPIDSRDQFQFVSDLTVRGKEALAKMGIAPATVMLAAGSSGRSG